MEIATNWVIIDGLGTVHPLPVNDAVDYSNDPDPECTVLSFADLAVDGSGYTLSFNQTNDMTSIPIISDAHGNTLNTSTNVLQDPDGNKITTTVTTTATSTTTVYTDTLGQTAMTATLQTPASTTIPDVYSYKDAQGNLQTYSINYTSMRVASVVCLDYGGDEIPATPMPTSIVQNTTGQRYSISYEANTSSPGSVTGRIAQITLPSGAFVNYAYSGGTNGDSCTGTDTGSTDVVPVLTKTVGDGNGHSDVWTYSNNYSGNSGPFNVTVTDPAANNTVYTFDREYQVAKQVYLDADKLIDTVYTCYNNSDLQNCGSQGPAENTSGPIITQTDVYNYPNNYAPASVEEAHYDNAGEITELLQYDYVSDDFPPLDYPSGPALRDTVIAYLGDTPSCGPLTFGFHQHDLPCSVTINGITGNGSYGVAKQTTYTYSGAGHPINTTQLVGGTKTLATSATYNRNGTIATSTDANGATTNYSYSGGCNNLLLTSIALPADGLTASQTWDCNGGVITSRTNTGGFTAGYSYISSSNVADPFWRVLFFTDFDQNQTSYTYSNTAPFTQEAVLPITGTSAVQDVLTTYDGLQRPIYVQTRQASGSSTFDTVQYQYGWTSNQGAFVSTSVPYAASTGQAAPSGTAFSTSQYDALGRPISVTDGGGGYLSYSYGQNDVLLTSGPAPAGENLKRRQIAYDALNRPTSVCELTAGSTAWPGVDCEQSQTVTGYSTEYSYDALGDLLSVVQNAQASTNLQSRSYAYDDLQRLTSSSNAEASGAYTYTYDSDSACSASSPGDLVKRVDAVGNTSCFSHDIIHRLTGITYPSGPYAASTPAKTFVYSSAANNTDFSPNYGYLSEAYTGPSTGKVTDEFFGYTASGRTQELVVRSLHSFNDILTNFWGNGAVSDIIGIPGNLPGVQTNLDSKGRINEVSVVATGDVASNITYNSANLPTQVTLGSGDIDSYSYDPNTLRMNQFQFTVGQTPQTLTGTPGWNANGSLGSLTISDPFNPANTQSCSYSLDDLSRIASANCGNAATQTFSYDPFGNNSKYGSPLSFSTLYTASNNHVAGPGYDANGNMTDDGLNTYTWDADGNNITQNSDVLTYDAMGRLIERNHSGTFTEHVYSPSGRLLAITAGQNLQQAFIPIPGGDVAVYNNNGLDHYRHADWLGSGRLISTPAQTVSSTVAYAPFGETYDQSGSDSSFTGAERDTGTNLDHLGARFYSSRMSRFISPDPSGLAYADLTNPQSLNLYSYVANGPLTAIDPTGLDGCDAGDNSDGDDGGDGDCDQGEDYNDSNDDGGFYDSQVIVQPYIDSSGRLRMKATYHIDAFLPVLSIVATSGSTDSQTDGGSSSGNAPNNNCMVVNGSTVCSSPLDDKYNKMESGKNYRDLNSVCSEHATVNGSGQIQSPHIDLFNPTQQITIGPGGPTIPLFPFHLVFDAIPDFIYNQTGYYPLGFAGRKLCP